MSSFVLLLGYSLTDNPSAHRASEQTYPTADEAIQAAWKLARGFTAQEWQRLGAPDTVFAFDDTDCDFVEGGAYRVPWIVHHIPKIAQLQRKRRPGQPILSASPDFGEAEDVPY